LNKKFENLESLLARSLEINNRRKCRAGSSLEHQLRYVFDRLGLAYCFSQTTEGSRRPDFIFPGIKEYRDKNYPDENLFFLGAKTTCKDRWRQILNEADRIEKKYLFTLQQGITSAQLQEMISARVTPVIPAEYHNRFKPDDRKYLLTLKQFACLVSEVHPSNSLFYARETS